MSATVAAARPGLARRHRSTLVVAAALVVAVAVVLVLGTGDDGRTARLDPDGSGGEGAQAVARVLDDEGVEVDVVRSADALDEADVDAGTTVVVTSAEQLGASTVERLLDRARDARVVVLEPGPELLDLLGTDGSTTPFDAGGAVPAGCDDPRYAGLEIEVDRGLGVPGATSCFGGALATTDDLVLLGAGDLVTNDQVTRADNAAVALRLLGQNDRLVWYVASYDDLGGEDGVDVWSLVPDWIRPGLAVVVLAVVALILWRGRRLGALATEPVPVTVRAIETTRSRGRLYRRAGDRAHAAGALRAATRSRARDRLGLGAGTDEAALVRDLARHVGRPEADLAALVGSQGPAPGTDRDLITLAHALTALEEEVRRS
ncbi:DUF4350 domain-containing protein [Nocardioides dongxiaopingii]|uniref:DUF4350 domain-containing protein n=1 Tax=Nocardioides sp. S-1144 TaxID=2582905 RepID=UPI001163BA46|nr:DUF4350 domain-containing protein [Nocardioides sp. S-1144]QCW51725.2 DUF4350 domain-containing protein [Nocardioides sp. S-1144]